MEKRYLSSSFIKSIPGLLSLIIIVFLNLPMQSWSQCSIPGNTICETAKSIHFPYAGRMTEEFNMNSLLPIPYCNGEGFYHNTNWYKVVPLTDYLLIEVTPNNCTDLGSGPGIQAALYSDCAPDAFPINGFIQCENIFPGQPIELGGQVVPGEPIYIMLDGWAGSTCDIEMVILLGAVELPIFEPLEIPEITITTLPEICPGGIIDFSTPFQPNADDYFWSVPSDAVILSQNCNSISVQWGATPGDVYVSVVNFFTGELQESSPLFIDIFQPQYFLTKTYCGSSTDGYLFYGDTSLYEEGFYTITVSGNNCDTIVSLSVIDTEPVLFLSGSSQTCENEGIITATTTGGVSPFTYTWSNGATGPIIDNLVGGDYTVTVTGADGCTAEGETTITFVNLFDLTVNSTPADCDESNGTASVTITGDISNPTYSWSNGATDSFITELSPGLYRITVTDTETNCQNQESVEVIEDPECSDNCPQYTVSDGNITVTNFNTARTKIRLWSTEGGWQQVFECDFDCNDPTVISGLSGDYRLKIDAFDDDYNYICKVDEDLVISGGPCIDNDDDGICASEDCDDNDPDFPVTPGTPCNDNNLNTDNDQIQSDGCSCAGTPTTPPTNDCPTYTVSDGTITVTNFNTERTKIRLWNTDGGWQQVFECDFDCNDPTVITGLSGEYRLKIDAFDDDYNYLCKVDEDLVISGGPCVDNDNDGVCAFEDCDDNDPDFPVEIGTACDDNDPNTTDDQIQSDGCTCAGTPETTDCATIIMTADDLTIIGNHPNQIIKVFNADWEFVFQCSGDCPNPVVIDNLSEQVYHIKVDAYDSDWNFVCKIREDLIPGASSANLRSDNTDFGRSKLTLFPNPTRGTFTLSTEDLYGSGEVKIYNAMGQLIQKRTIKNLRAQDFLNFDLSNNSSGLYYVVVQMPRGELITESVVINHQ